MDPTQPLSPADDETLHGWRFERIDARNVRVTCPYFSRPLDLNVDHPERTHRALFNLAVDALERSNAGAGH